MKTQKWLMTVILVSGLALSVGCALVGHAQSQSRGVFAGKQHPPVTSITITSSPERMARYNALNAQGFALEKQAGAYLEAHDYAAAANYAQQAITFYESYQPDLNAVLLPVATSQRQLLGDIFLKEGQYQKALDAYGVVGKYTRGEGAPMGAGFSLNIAWAYYNLGNYKAARHYYSDQSLLQYSNIKPEDLPGTDSLVSLKASILMARGVNDFYYDRHQEAFQELEEAGRLAPTNGAIPYHQGMLLMYMNRRTETLPYFARAATYGHGKVAKDASKRILGWPAVKRDEAMRQAATQKTLR